MANLARAAPLILAILAQLISQAILATKLLRRSAGDPPEDSAQVNEGNDQEDTSEEKISDLKPSQVTISEGAKKNWRTFEGIGALSAGASSRLLQDYPDEQRADILDLLFKPGYGASLQVLKVEIGGDAQSTDGSEPSHMRFRGEDPDCTRGYEGWLVQEAKARNPAIRTYGLAWGVPGWIGNGSFFSEDNIKYHVAWLECMNVTYSTQVDYIGIWNEMSWGSSWYVVKLGKAIKAAGLSTKLVLLDAINGVSAEFLKQFQTDKELQQLTAAVGLHYPCGEKGKAPTQLLQALAARPATRFWASEELSTVADWGGAGCWGRMINQNFVRMQATSSIAWSLIWSAYPNLECFGNGLLYAFSPWSGNYEVMPPVWATAHTTQFTEPGWQYLPVGAGAGNLPDGGTFVTIASPDLKDFSIILETLTGRCMYHDGCFHEKEAQSTQLLELKLSSTLAVAAKSGGLEVWATNQTDWFVQLDDAAVDENGVVKALMPVDAIITITTLRKASKQGLRANSEMDDSKASIPDASAFPLPFKENFESRDVGRSPPFFADQGGAFEVTEIEDEKGENKVLEQKVTQAPIAWIGKTPWPFSVFGSSNWTDVTFEASVNLGPPRSRISRIGPISPFGSAVHKESLLSQHVVQTASEIVRLGGICTRVLRYNYFGKSDAKPNGYCLEVIHDPNYMPYWRLTSSGDLVTQERLSNIAINKVLGGGWLKLRLAAQQAQISLFVDGRNVFNFTDTALPMGQVALGCGYHNCQFDDVVVSPNKAHAETDRQNMRLQLVQVQPVSFDYTARSCEPPPQMPPLRKDFTGLVGFAFTPTVPMFLTSLGRYITRGGNPQFDVHQIQLLQVVDKVTYVPLATAVLPSVFTQQVGIHTTADGFMYADLVSNVSLQPGAEYVLASSEITQATVFYDKVTRAKPMKHAKLLGPIYVGQTGGWVLMREEADHVFGPLNALFAPIPETSKDSSVLLGEPNIGKKVELKPQVNFAEVTGDNRQQKEKSRHARDESRRTATGVEKMEAHKSEANRAKAVQLEQKQDETQQDEFEQEGTDDDRDESDETGDRLSENQGELKEEMQAEDEKAEDFHQIFAEENGMDDMGQDSSQMSDEQPE